MSAINENQFYKWLARRVSATQLSEMYSAFETIKEYCISKRILDKPMFDSSDIGAVTQARDIVYYDPVFKSRMKKKRAVMTLVINYFLDYAKKLSTMETTRAPLSDPRVKSTKKNVDVTIVLQKKGVEYFDFRPKGGCLWIIGGIEQKPLVDMLRFQGYSFGFVRSGTKATGGKSAWWTKDNYEIAEEAINNQGTLQQKKTTDENKDEELETRVLRIEWDKYETALLIEACMNVNEGLSKKDESERLSAQLRECASNQGVKIDELYRNTNGIFLQMTKMEYFLSNGTKGLPGGSKLFEEMARLKKDCPEEFETVLKAAKQRIVEKTVADPIGNDALEIVDKGTTTEQDVAKGYTAVVPEVRELIGNHRSLIECCAAIREEHPDYVLSNRDDRGVTQADVVYIFNKSRVGWDDDLIKIRRVAEDNAFLVFGKLEIFTPEEKPKMRRKSAQSTVSRGVVIKKWKYVDELVNYIELKIGLLHQTEEKEEPYREVPDETLGEKAHTLCDRCLDAHDVLLDCIEPLAPMFPDYTFTNLDARNIPQKRAVYVYRKDVQRRGNVLLEIWRTLVEDTYVIFCKRFLLTDEEDAEAQREERIKETRGKIRKNWKNADEIMEFVREKLTIANYNTEKIPTTAEDLLTPKDKERFELVLFRRFRNGMQFDSIDFENFREMYEMLFDESLGVDDEVLKRQLLQCGVFYGDRLFPAEGIIDEGVKEKLFGYIDKSFASGKKVLYYKAIFEDLSDVFESCFSLCDANMLRAYIEFTAEKGKYYFFSDYMAVEQNVTIDHTAEVKEFMLGTGKPVATEEVCAALSNIPKDQVARIIAMDNHFLRNAKGEYFHVDIFEVSDMELEQIAEVISEHIRRNEYAIWTDVWNELHEKMPVFLENNLYLSWLGIRNALAQSFRGRFNFESAVISLPKDRYAMRDIYQLYAKHHAEFTADDIYNLSKELDTAIYYDALAEVSVRVSHDLFVSKHKINFDVDMIDKAIESFLAKEYICIREIDSFLVFPNVGYEWNEYLLESFVYSYSNKYKLLNNGFSLHNVAGAVVKKSGSIKEFVDACAVVLADSTTSLNKNDALNYLADVNMITRRSYRDLELAIRKAMQIRGRKG